MLLDRLLAQVTAFGLACLVTAGTLSGIGALSVSEHAATDLLTARAAAHAVQASGTAVRAPRS